MGDESIPDELVELENRLRGRSRAEPGGDLRDRIMHAVRVELPVPAQRAVLAGKWGWHKAAIAAGVLIIMHLSMISASVSAFSAGSTRGGNQTVTEFQALQRLEAQEEGMLK
jgi:hypothetical protein